MLSRGTLIAMAVMVHCPPLWAADASLTFSPLTQAVMPGDTVAISVSFAQPEELVGNIDIWFEVGEGLQFVGADLGADAPAIGILDVEFEYPVACAIPIYLGPPHVSWRFDHELQTWGRITAWDGEVFILRFVATADRLARSTVALVACLPDLEGCGWVNLSSIRTWLGDPTEGTPFPSKVYSACEPFPDDLPFVFETIELGPAAEILIQGPVRTSPSTMSDMKRRYREDD
jgi:hypothetical protein